LSLASSACAHAARLDAALAERIRSVRAPGLEWLMSALSDPRNAVLLGVVFIPLWLWAARQPGRWQVLLVGALLLAAADSSSTFVKKLVGRPRPCASLTVVLPVTPCGKSPSLPSGHATNTTALAVLVAAHDRRRRVLWYGGAALVGISRVSLGAHYPTDVLAGAALGALVGSTGVWLSRVPLHRSAAPRRGAALATAALAR
jgi:undecaprenyl-diphosphatase